jgi:cytochrome P450
MQCRRKLNAVFQEVLEARKKADTGCDDLMSGLMQMEDEQGKKLSDNEVVDNIVSLVIAGYESTTTAIIWATYHLAKSPVVLAKLREENVAMNKSKSGSTLASLMITYDDIPKMKYTTKVVEETIRMANISTMVFRVANMDVEYHGYIIPKGWPVLVWLRSLHTDPNYYQDPLTFNPDRWDVSLLASSRFLQLKFIIMHHFPPTIGVLHLFPYLSSLNRQKYCSLGTSKARNIPGVRRWQQDLPRQHACQDADHHHPTSSLHRL